MDIIKSKKEIKRVKTHIKGFDENMEGGIPEGHLVLVSGKSGTMKSSMAFNILYNEALNGNTGLYLNLEQSSDSLLKNMVNMDFDLSKVNLVIISDLLNFASSLKSISPKKGSLIIADIEAVRKKIHHTKFFTTDSWLVALKSLVDKISKKSNCGLFVLDSINAVYSLSSFEGPRPKIFYVFDFLRNMGLTSLILSEPRFDDKGYSQFGVEEYLADGIIFLELTRRYRKVTREISIPKMRATDCNLDIFTLEYANKKFNAIYGGKTPMI